MEGSREKRREEVGQRTSQIRREKRTNGTPGEGQEGGEANYLQQDRGGELRGAEEQGEGGTERERI